MTSADQQILKKLDQIAAAQGGGGGVSEVTGAAPIESSGGVTPAISIAPATTSDPGSMSAADKTKLDNAPADPRSAAQVAALISAGKVSAITQTAHGLAVKDLVRHNGTDYVKAQADTEANAEVVGIVSEVADANNFSLSTFGLVTGLSGLTAGETYFLSPTTAGALTATEPSTDDQVSKPVGIAPSTTSLYFFNMRGIVVASGGGGAASILSTGGGTSVVADDTQYVTFGGTVTFASSESVRQIIIPRAGTLRNFFITTSSGQAADGDLTLTVRVNGVDTGIVIVVAASAAAGVFSDVTNTAAVVAGDLVSVSGLNTSPGTATAALNRLAITIE